MKTVEILDPRSARPTIDSGGQRVEIVSLATASVALLHNGNGKFDRIADSLAERLAGMAGAIHTYRKARYGSPVTDEMRGEILEENSFVVTGLAC